MLLRYPFRFLPLVAAMLLLAAGCKDMPVDVPKVDIPDNLVPDFSLNCPGVTEHAAKVDTFLVIGHRGVASKEVENTIPSMQRAMDEGANALEIDLCMTKDGHIVLWHDWNPDDAIALARESGGEFGIKFRPRFPPVGSDLRRPVDELNLDEFREHYWYTTKNLIKKDRLPVEVPTLQQFMEWGAKKEGLYYVMLDLKLPASKAHLSEIYIAKIDSIIKSYQPTFKSVYMTPQPSVWEVISRFVDGLAFDVDLGGGLVNDETCNISSSSYARRKGGGFATTMHPFVWTETPWTTLKRLLACDLQTRDAAVEPGQPRLVEKVLAATINNADKMECLINLGVDGLITDDPGLLSAIARQMGKKVR